MAFLDETGLAHFWNQILARLNKFVPAETGKGLSSNDYTTEEKEKLAGVESGANKTTVDSSLSSTSTNPVQNKIINTKLTTMQSDIDSKADGDHTHSELVNGNASVVLNVDTGAYGLSPQYITTYLPESTTVYSYLGTPSNKWDHVYARNINLNGTDLQSTLNSKVPSTRTVNGKALTANITLSASDVGALPNTTQIPSIDGLATEIYVDNKVAGLVDSAPATLDTLNELAAALGDDSNFATTVATQIGTKVDKVDGKGLSTNDYTTEEKTKLASIEEGANKTVVDTALSATSTNPVQNKVINTKLTTMQSDIDSKVPSARTVNGKPLSANITLSVADIGAAPAAHTHDSIVEQNTQTAQKFWSGTKDEYDAIITKDNDTVYIVTDDAGEEIEVVYAPSIHASQHASGGSDPITPADIGALPTTGGTMTGALWFDNGFIGCSDISLYTKTTEGPCIYGSYQNNIPVVEILGSIGDEDTYIRGVRTPSKSNDAANKQYVDDAVATINPNYTYGTTDLAAGVSELAEGTLYFVYE